MRMFLVVLGMFGSISTVAVGLSAVSSVASANTMTFGIVNCSPGANCANPYTEDSIIATATSPASGTHFDIGDMSAVGLGGSPSNSVAAIHRGNGGEQVMFTFSGGAFNLLSVDITGWIVDSSGLTGTFTSSGGGTTTVSASTTGTIDFTAISGFADITSFLFSVPLGVGTCSAQVFCAEVGFDNVSLAAPTVGNNTPLPGALPLFGSVLAGAAFLARRRKRKAQTA